MGLSSADLIAASPEDSFLQVITALQGVTNASDKKFLADELLGGSSEKLSGIINTSSEEFQGLTDSIRENGDIISNEGIANANQFNIALGKLGRARLVGYASYGGHRVYPDILTEIIEGVSPRLWQEIDGPVLTVLRHISPTLLTVHFAILSFEIMLSGDHKDFRSRCADWRLLEGMAGCTEDSCRA